VLRRPPSCPSSITPRPLSAFRLDFRPFGHHVSESVSVCLQIKFSRPPPNKSGLTPVRPSVTTERWSAVVTSLSLQAAAAAAAAARLGSLAQVHQSRAHSACREDNIEAWVDCATTESHSHTYDQSINQSINQLVNAMTESQQTSDYVSSFRRVPVVRVHSDRTEDKHRRNADQCAGSD